MALDSKREGGSARAGYEAVPYASRPVPASAPARLAAAAARAGLEAAPPERARVLELGCADGANLIPLAYRAPEASFLGVDLTQGAVSMGRSTIGMLELDNIELEHADLMDLDPAQQEPFDYVICHGLYSWVDEPVRRRILELCRELLSDRGLAYLSYNALPGWRLRGVVRDLAQKAAGPSATEQQALAAVRALPELLGDVIDPSHPYGALLASELQILAAHPDGYVRHDYLEEHNRAFYFGEMLERIEAAGLRHLVELLDGPFGTGKADSCRAALAAKGLGGVPLEELVDAVCFRTFRAALLCRQGRAAGELEGDQRWIYVGSFTAKAEEPLLGPGKPLTFLLSDGSELTTEQPLLKVALLMLGELWPSGLDFDELLGGARQLLQQRGFIPAEAELSDEATEAFAGDLAELRRSGRLETRLSQPQLDRRLSERPAIERLAHFQVAVHGYLTTPTHDLVPVDPFTRQLVPHLDGERELGELVEQMAFHVERGAITVEGLPDDAVARHEALARLVSRSLAALVKLGVLGG